MLSIQIQGRYDKLSAKSINVKVEPSVKVKPGVYIQVNCDYRPDDGSAVGSASFLEHVKEDWDNSQAFAIKVAEHLLQQKY
jgi:hypothetical protein